VAACHADKITCKRAGGRECWCELLYFFKEKWCFTTSQDGSAFKDAVVNLALFERVWHSNPGLAKPASGSRTSKCGAEKRSLAVDVVAVRLRSHSVDFLDGKVKQAKRKAYEKSHTAHLLIQVLLVQSSPNPEPF